MKTARILLLSDKEYPLYSKSWTPASFQGIDLIISCGDLPSRYLEFIADRFDGYVLYVPGNHDRNYVTHPPLGCVNIDEKIFTWKGLRFLGLGGTMWYNDGPWQYSEKEMKKRIRKLWFPLLKSSGFDILVTHAPAFGHYDGKDRCHTGFQSFNELIERYRPLFFFHGHIHLNYGKFPRRYTIDETVAINGYKRCIVTVPLPDEEDTHVFDADARELIEEQSRPRPEDRI